MDKKKPPGRPRTTTQEQDNDFVQYLEENPFQIVRAAIQQTNFPASRPTGCRRVKDSHLKNYVAAKKMKLGEEHKQARIIFALNNILRHDWNRVVFTDEKVFQSTVNGHIRVYRPRNTRYTENYISNSERSGRFSVNVWAWVSYHGLGVCWIVNERFNAVTYKNILEYIMMPSVSQHFPDQSFIYQHDNCPVHSAGMIKEWFQRNNVETLSWPSKSPDINIIENVWGVMTRKIYKANFRPANRDELVLFIEETWNELSDDLDFVRSLYLSIPNRLNELLQKNGAITKH